MFNGQSFDSMHAGDNIWPQYVADAGGMVNVTGAHAPETETKQIWDGAAWVPLDTFPTTFLPHGNNQFVEANLTLVYPYTFQIDIGPAKAGRHIIVAAIAVKPQMSSSVGFTMRIGGQTVDKFQAYVTAGMRLLIYGIIKDDTMGGLVSVELTAAGSGVPVHEMWSTVAYEIHAPSKSLTSQGLNFDEGIQPAVTSNVNVIALNDTFMMVLAAHESPTEDIGDVPIDPDVMKGRPWEVGVTSEVWADTTTGFWPEGDPSGIEPVAADYANASLTGEAASALFHLMFSPD